MTADADVPAQRPEGFQRLAPPGHRQAPVALTGAPVADIVADEAPVTLAAGS